MVPENGAGKNGEIGEIGEIGASDLLFRIYDSTTFAFFLGRPGLARLTGYPS